MSTISVYIADDYYNAYLSIKYEEGEPITVDDVVDLMNEKNIVYGTDNDVILALCQLNDSVVDEVVAVGQPHINGIDAELIYHYEAAIEAHPSIAEDGSVDFKDLGILQKVVAGEVLATKIPATDGINGMTVTGKVINARNGKDVNFSIGENVEISEDGLSVIASETGIYRCNDNKIYIDKYLEFPEGVGLSTGNVFFNGDVHVEGNVIDGYRIECDGNLTINGLVEGASLTVQGDLAVSKGIAGHNQSVIYCGGNLVTKYIDHSEVKVKGSLEAGEILNSKVMCDGEISVKGKKGHILGGEITAKYAINATTIGSRLGVITLINLGIDIESMEELKSLKEAIFQENEVNKKLKQFIEVLHIKEAKGIMTTFERDKLGQCENNLEQSDFNLKEKKQQYAVLKEMLLKAQNGQIKTETIYADTMIKIGRSSYFIDDALLRSIIKKSGDEIVAISF